MTPKGKAINLFNSYVKLLPLGSNVERAKQCALIAVDEMIEIRNEIFNTLKLGGLNIEVITFLEKVKQEIEIL